MAVDLINAQSVAGAWVRCLTKDLSDPDQVLNVTGGSRYTSRMLIDDLRAGNLTKGVTHSYWAPDQDVRVYILEKVIPPELVIEVRVEYPDGLGGQDYCWTPVTRIPTPAWALTQTTTAAIPPPPPNTSLYNRTQAQIEADRLAKTFPQALVTWDARLGTVPVSMTAKDLLEGVRANTFPRSLARPTFNRISIGLTGEWLLIRPTRNGYEYRVAVDWTENGQSGEMTSLMLSVAEPAWMISQPTINFLSTAPLTQQIATAQARVHSLFTQMSIPLVTMPAQSKPTLSSGPPCPTCGGPTTLLFIHSVCDRCEPAGGQQAQAPIQGSYRGFIVWRDKPDGGAEYVFQTEDDAERWRHTAGVDHYPVREVTSPSEFYWRTGTGTIPNLQVAKSLYRIYRPGVEPHDRSETNAFLVP